MTFIGNRYELLNCDGQLELNKIYKARDVFDNKKVLIKVVEHNEYMESNFITNLIDETTMINNIHSKYISKTIDVGVHCTELTTLYYMVSEYYNGITLVNMINGNYLHLEAIINIATQIVKALEILHENNVYHGNLNPTNILVDKDYNIRLLNFQTTKANNGINIRAGGEFRYLCPHQLCINFTDLDSDLFSLGIILFESIFKKLPFEEGKNEEEMLKNIDKGINWNQNIAINGNDKFINIIKKLLSKNEKYEYLQDILIDLSNVMYEKADIIDTEEINEDIEETIERPKKIKKRKILLAVSMISLVFITILSIL
ncbi:protein kinase [Romboutsia sp. 1001216sp1]|uniref:protein kinase domain-containing protein n=1 Tax=Romboutsia sp. 1001216sp1 TaxID=2986997 RepID=UPI00232BAEAF|nr:protein kinase [Romboutsia sp. 1001216sp1]MDB8820151.1 protein kinase [Romboutsia sp. 1001216sp1]